MTTPRLLPKPLTAFRIGDPAGTYPIFSAEGARRIQGRWHDIGDRVIYASEHYSTAMLEKLVHWNGLLPPNQHAVEITVPAGVSYEVVTQDTVPGWDAPSGDAARSLGHDWYVSRRSAVLLVPSVVARPDRNIVLNADHAEFPRIEAGLETPVRWDSRLFARN